MDMPFLVEVALWVAPALFSLFIGITMLIKMGREAVFSVVLLGLLLSNLLFLGLYFVIEENTGILTTVPHGVVTNVADGLFVRYEASGARYFRWDPAVQDITWKSLWGATGKRFDVELQPITENPKVRLIHYELFVTIDLTTEGVGALWSATNGNPFDWQRIVDVLLYDFNEEHSRELAQFYNPLREEQQRAFENLLRSFLEPKLAVLGLKFEEASFSLK